MTSARASAVARTIVAGLGIAVVVLSVTLVNGPATTGSGGRGTTYGSYSTLAAMLEVVVALILASAATLLLAARSTAFVGVLTAMSSLTFVSPLWTGWEGGPELVRSLGLIASPLLPALILAIAASVPPRARGVRGLALFAFVAAVGAACVIASIGVALVREPIRDLYCWSNCTANVFLVHDDADLARRLGWVMLGLGVACGLSAALVGLVRLGWVSAASRRGSGLSLGAAALTGIALAAYSAALLYEPRESPGRPLYEALFLVRALALLALGCGLAWLAVRPRYIRGLVTRLAVDLERSAAEGGVARLLAGALRDPGLRLGYPIGGGERLVDAGGRPVVTAPSRRVTPIVGEEGVVAVVESDAPIDALERELGPAAHLALGNERLRAEALARLDEVTASRTRIVETADAARRRMERDLHDGAQQRMLALTADLRVALTIAESSGDHGAVAPLRRGLERALEAAEELREIAHGIFPAELAMSGLEAALESLADLRPLLLDVRLPVGRRYPPDVEIAAYAVVVEALDSAGHGTVSVVLDEREDALHLAVEGVDAWGDRLVRVEDRTGAAGGDLSIERGRFDVRLPSV